MIRGTGVTSAQNSASRILVSASKSKVPPVEDWYRPDCKLKTEWIGGKVDQGSLRSIGQTMSFPSNLGRRLDGREREMSLSSQQQNAVGCDSVPGNTRADERPTLSDVQLTSIWEGKLRICAVTRWPHLVPSSNNKVPRTLLCHNKACQCLELGRQTGYI